MNARTRNTYLLDDQAEKAKAEKGFQKLDEDGSGTLSVSELKGLVTRFAPGHEAILDAVLMQIDANGSGIIEWGEFSGWVNPVVQKVREKLQSFETERLSKAFRKLDKDNSLCVDVKELTLLVERWQVLL